MNRLNMFTTLVVALGLMTACSDEKEVVSEKSTTEVSGDWFTKKEEWKPKEEQKVVEEKAERKLLTKEELIEKLLTDNGGEITKENQIVETFNAGNPVFRILHPEDNETVVSETERTDPVLTARQVELYHSQEFNVQGYSHKVFVQYPKTKEEIAQASKNGIKYRDNVTYNVYTSSRDGVNIKLELPSAFYYMTPFEIKEDKNKIAIKGNYVSEFKYYFSVDGIEISSLEVASNSATIARYGSGTGYLVYRDTQDIGKRVNPEFKIYNKDTDQVIMSVQVPYKVLNLEKINFN